MSTDTATGVTPSAARTGSVRYGVPLTHREAQVLALVAQGCTNDVVGRRLYLATDTVKTHLRQVSTKLGARDRTHAVTKAIAAGFLVLLTDGRVAPCIGECGDGAHTPHCLGEVGRHTAAVSR